MSQSSRFWFYGNHPCLAILNNPARTVYEVSYIHQKALEKFQLKTLSSSIKIRQVEKNWFDTKFGPEAVHQGIAVQCSPLPDFSTLDLANDTATNQLVILLDQVSDPHNIGAILRTAAAFNAKAIIMTERHAPNETAILAKSASGALELVPIIRFSNLAHAIQELKDIGFWIYGFAESGSTPLAQTTFSGKVALIMGAEGTGIRDLTRKNCDFLVHLETSDTFSTLNVSNAAAIAMYEVFKDFV